MRGSGGNGEGETFSCILFTDFSLPGVGIVSSAFLCKWCGVVVS